MSECKVNCNCNDNGTCELNEYEKCGIFRSYEQGKKDRDREIAESAVFVSNRPIEDIVLDAITKERLRIVRELKENKKSLVGRYDSSTPVSEMPSYKAAFNKGIDTAIKIVEEV